MQDLFSGQEWLLESLATQLREIGELIEVCAADAIQKEDRDDESRTAALRLGLAADHVAQALAVLTRESVEEGVEGPGAERTLLRRVLGELRQETEERQRRSFFQGLRGKSATVGVAEFMGLLANLGKSGILCVHTPRERFVVELSHGELIYAHGDAPPDGTRLGDVLVQVGATTRAELEEFFASGLRNESEFLGTALYRVGCISENDLQRALRVQIQLLVARMVASQDARFFFEEDMKMVVEPEVRMNVTQLLLESARLADEASHKSALDLLDDPV